MSVVGSNLFEDPSGDDRRRIPTGGAGVRTVLHSHLKDLAIDALEMSTSRDQASLAQTLGFALMSFDAPPEMAEILSSMVAAAYSLALDCSDERLLHQAYSCFSDAQLARIIQLARTA